MNNTKKPPKNGLYTVSMRDLTRAIPFVLLGFVIAMICSSQRTVREGLDFLFVLPLAFSCCRFIFAKAFRYWKDNIAFTIIFATIYVRYLFAPLLISLSGTCITTLSPSPASYRAALIIQTAELFVTLFLINSVWGKYRATKSVASKQSPKEETPSEFKLSPFGAAFIALLILLVLSRGNLQNVVDHLSTWWEISKDTSDLYFYDLMAIDVAKSALSISIIAFLASRYHKTESVYLRIFLFVLALAVGVGSTVYYQYTQRTALAQLMLGVMVMMISFFPKQKKLLRLIFGVGGLVFVFYIFAIGSMHYEVGGANDNLLERSAKMAELYVSGPSMVAVTRDNYSWVTGNMDFMTYLSDFFNSVHIFGLFPGLRNIMGIVAGVPTTNQLFVDSLKGLTYILPNYNLCTYYVSDLFGWLLEIVVIYLVIKSLCFLDRKKSRHNDGCYYYAIAYTEILLGQVIFVNNFLLFVHAFTNLPFWILVFWFVNSLWKKIKIRY